MSIQARLVWDGGDEVRIPPEMGMPRADQMQGTALERLCELAGRICYDSLGKGRSSADYHAHIAEVGHTSVHEHAVITVHILEHDWQDYVRACANRRGVFVEIDTARTAITFNLRAINEWERHTTRVNRTRWNEGLRRTLKHHAHNLAPSIVEYSPETLAASPAVLPGQLDDNQAHVSLLVPSSRVVGEEFIRHRYSPSKRSTRYCNEESTPWVVHPLLMAYISDNDIPARARDVVWAQCEKTIALARHTYSRVAIDLESYLKDKGVDSSTARKQAKGAARGFLGLALETEMIFTASVAGWRDILRQRLSPHADAEIREVAASALAALRESRYAARFDDLRTAPAPDGLGVVLA